MKNNSRIMDIVNRGLEGPLVEESEFDKKHVTQGIRRVVADYDIKVDTDTIINQNDSLADRVWNAAVDFLVTCGVYNKDSGRVIIHSRKEIDELLNGAPSQVLLGEGNDSVLEKTRKVEDTNRLIIDGCSIGSPISEEYYIPVLVSYAQEPIIDVTCTNSLETVQGHDIRTRTPLEILAAWEEMDLSHIALKRAGRPGMALTGCTMSMSDIGQLSAAHPRGLRSTDLHTFGIISELKTNYEILNKITHTIRIGGIVDGYANAIFGGLGGGPDGHAVLVCAEMIALSVVFQATCVGASPTHPFLFCSTDKKMMAAASVAYQAIARNSHLMTNLSVTAVGGPVTKTLLYETIAYSLMATLSGNSRLLGPRPATGVISGHYTGLEARFMGEVCHAGAGLSRSKAEEIAEMAYAKYAPEMDKKPFGKPFWEAYDVKTVKPTDEWLKMYEEVKNEAISWGLPIK